MIQKILIANRGEIARRIMKTCHDMGIGSVAVYSDVDRHSIHVMEAEQSICLNGSEPKETYLNIDKIIQAAKIAKVDAIHPGYGFLSENETFAKRCEQENIIFIGPPSNVIASLGDKTVARQIMQKSGVPITPGMTKPESDPVIIASEAEKIGYPILIKAAGGGGGKGMRIVNSSKELKDAIISASSEALSAFGNGAVYIEKYLACPRHVEFQILADKYGNVIHLLERECSIQRRHQKIIEETPSQALTQSLRDEMGKAAVAAASASGYVNAGTVEFLLDSSGKFYFLEVNTRLQVEHPITEMVTGLDLVRYQIEIASGKPLSLKQSDIKGRGHAIECRIYAEDPVNSFMPSPGKIVFMKEPSGPGIRNDCGVYSGFQVPLEYDPILSKLIAYAETREQAIQRMVTALKNYIVLGIKTPIPFLIDVLNSEAFKKGQTYTDFIPTHFSNWKPKAPDTELACIAWLADTLNPKQNVTYKKNEVTSPWFTLGNWRM